MLQGADEPFNERVLPRVTGFNVDRLTALFGNPLLDFIGNKFER